MTGHRYYFHDDLVVDIEQEEGNKDRLNMVQMRHVVVLLRATPRRDHNAMKKNPRLKTC